MIITRQDLLDIFVNEPNKLKEIYSDMPTTLKYAKSTNQLDIANFYEKIRKSYNEHHSKVYINIMKEIDDTKKVLTTLSALETQILLYSLNVSNKQMFFRHSRFEEITRALNNYSQTMDLKECVILIQNIKKDIKYLQQI